MMYSASSRMCNGGAGFKLTAANAQKRFPLLMSTLDGLTKFAHLISVEYFADLLQVYKHQSPPPPPPQP